MINIVKSQPAPICLEDEKKKNNGTYLCGDTYKRVSDDFFGKCYLCEDNKPTKINVEHFKPHYQGKDKDRKFDWNNLFFACGHCNGIKSSNEIEILNCTNPNHKITEWIKFDIKPFPKEQAKISAVEESEIVKNTVKLLDTIYNYQIDEDKFTPTKEQASKLREKLIKEIDEFVKFLKAYYEEDWWSDSDKAILKRKIKWHINNSNSPFSAFKLWIVKENKVYQEDFLK